MALKPSFNVICKKLEFHANRCHQSKELSITDKGQRPAKLDSEDLLHQLKFQKDVFILPLL